MWGQLLGRYRPEIAAADADAIAGQAGGSIGTPRSILPGRRHGIDLYPLALLGVVGAAPWCANHAASSPLPGWRAPMQKIRMPPGRRS